MSWMSKNTTKTAVCTKCMLIYESIILQSLSSLLLLSQTQFLRQTILKW